jgi:predicted metalloprotease with PDZ domain
MEQPLDVSLTWDLSGLPSGCRAVSSFGNGDFARKDCTISDLLFSAYMVGKINSVEEGAAGFYWFDTLPFPAREGAGQITALFGYMSRMFRDPGGEYRVFTRHNQFPGGGGTAFRRSYIYGYGQHDEVTIEGLQSLLAHEMVHNWPTMSDVPAGRGTWYVEGSAEYYSTLVPMEMGLCSLEKTAAVINDKAGSYYANPCQNLSNLELGERYWTDRRCQRLPYARGMIYLSNLDAAIRRSTGGQKTLLDLELALLELSSPTPEDFLRIGQEIAGFDLRPGYEAMCAGGMIEPDPEVFGGRFQVTPCMVRLNNAQHRVDEELLDEEVPGYHWSVK